MDTTNPSKAALVIRKWLAKPTACTQGCLALAVGIHPSRFVRILNGSAQPTLYQAIQLQKLTGASVMDWETK
jgi:plasmid maintenance system antidote protein VapI